jgi:DNA-binding GntR family transcriptional regulator
MRLTQLGIEEHNAMAAKRSADDVGDVPASAEQRVFDAVRDAIFEHQLAPGTKLKEVSLAELFGVSRAVVRSALARLGHAHLVEQRPNRGAVVATPSIEESRQVFEARTAIEEAIVAKVARAASAGDVALLREWVASEEAAYARGDERGGVRRSVDFHRRLAEIAGNRVLSRFLDELVSRTPLIALAHRGHAPAPCGCDDHIALVGAIAAHDERRAKALMRDHIAHLERALNLRHPEKPKSLAEVFGLAPAGA